MGGGLRMVLISRSPDMAARFVVKCQKRPTIGAKETYYMDGAHLPQS
jgi:hypothetical protein